MPHLIFWLFDEIFVCSGFHGAKFEYRRLWQYQFFSQEKASCYSCNLIYNFLSIRDVNILFYVYVLANISLNKDSRDIYTVTTVD